MSGRANIRRKIFVPFSLALAAATVTFVVRTFGPLDADAAQTQLGGALSELVERGEVRSAVMWVDAPSKGINRGFAFGLADVAHGRPMQQDTPFYSASTGKMLLAASVMTLVADGRLALDAPVTRFLPRAELAGIPIEGGESAFERVTIAMLLAHRTGLPDYFSDLSRDGAPRLFDLIAQAPAQTWTRAQMLDYARAHYAPAGAVGTSFHYSDTNYDLLGMVLEHVTGNPFYIAVRKSVIEPLQLQRTWYHAFEPAPPNAPQPADVWVRGVNLRGAPALSVDQAGGGLLTTVGDLRLLLRALVAGRPVPLSVFNADITPDAMHAGIDVGRCMWRIRPGSVSFALSGMPVLVGHSGATGVWAYYAADWDTVLVGSVSDADWQERHAEFLLSKVLPTLARVR